MSNQFNRVITPDGLVIRKLLKSKVPYKEKLFSYISVSYTDWKLFADIMDWLYSDIKGECVIPIPAGHYIYFEREDEAIFYRMVWDKQ